jgi:hypothetical protein
VACLAFMLVGDDGLWNVEEGEHTGTMGQRPTAFHSLIHGSSRRTAESHRPFLIPLVYSIFCPAAYIWYTFANFSDPPLGLSISVMMSTRSIDVTISQIAPSIGFQR